MTSSETDERIFLGLGSNLGDREEYLQCAVEQITKQDELKLIARSGIYETEPVGRVSQPEFLNQVVEVRTGYEPKRLLDCLKQIERGLGRRDGERWGPRKIDIDLLLYGNRVLQEAGLILPHPEMEHRRFVLVPLAELAPDVVHPVLGETIADLLRRLRDTRGVRPYRSKGRKGKRPETKKRF